MKWRAFIICLLLLSQPFSSFAAVWQPTHTNDSAAGDLIAGHCDTEEMVGHQQPLSDDATENDHSDCNNSCDLCAACAAVVAEQLTLEQLHARPVNSRDVFLLVPPGKTNHPYRPPILS
jgi:hypothetical protein